MNSKRKRWICSLLFGGICLGMLSGCGSENAQKADSSESALAEELSEQEELLSEWLGYCDIVAQQLDTIRLCVKGEETLSYRIKPGEMIYGSESQTYIEDLHEKQTETIEGSLSILDVTCGMTLEELEALQILEENQYLEVKDDSHQFYLAWYPENGQWKPLNFAEDSIENHTSMILVMFDLETVQDTEQVRGMFCECY